MSEKRLLQILSDGSKRLPSLNFFIPLSTEVSYLASWGPGSFAWTTFYVVKEESFKADRDEKSKFKLNDV